MRRDNFDGGKGRPIAKYRDTAVICAKTAELIVMPYGLWARTDPRNHKLYRVQILPWEGAILGKRGADCKA